MHLPTSYGRGGNDPSRVDPHCFCDYCGSYFNWELSGVNNCVAGAVCESCLEKEEE